MTQCEPSELKKKQVRALAEAWRALEETHWGSGRWMPLNARLQELIDAKAPFEDLVEEARFYMIVDEHIIQALGLLGVALADQSHGLPEPDFSDRL